jgi:putative mRNA 3-end processing factor
VDVSLHPAGHVLGSAQVRVGDGQRTWVVTGDYKRAPDPTCAPFERVPCDVLVTEATFALPIYRWPAPEIVAGEVLAWWEACRAEGVPAVLFAYALGKAQRLLGELARLTDRPVWTHGAVEGITAAYRAEGIPLLPTLPVGEERRSFAGELILAPPSAGGSPWMKRFPGAQTGFASGWMQVRGARRRQNVDRGFVLSDHTDWPGLVRTIRESGARRILPTHGSSDALVRWLREQGFEAEPLATAFEGEGEPA